MRREAVLTRGDMATRSGHTSWEGVPVTAMPVYTVVRGRPVMEMGKITGTPGYGRIMTGRGARKGAAATRGSAPLAGME